MCLRRSAMPTFISQLPAERPSPGSIIPVTDWPHHRPLNLLCPRNLSSDGTSERSEFTPIAPKTPFPHFGNHLSLFLVVDHHRPMGFGYCDIKVFCPFPNNTYPQITFSVSFQGPFSQGSFTRGSLATFFWRDQDGTSLLSKEGRSTEDMSFFQKRREV